MGNEFTEMINDYFRMPRVIELTRKYNRELADIIMKTLDSEQDDEGSIIPLFYSVHAINLLVENTLRVKKYNPLIIEAVKDLAVSDSNTVLAELLRRLTPAVNK